ncbi:ATP-binding cassette domain-containing protein [Leptospira santarosai]|uniref:ABC transporter ATP-binding protein n=1 Tax=Leptospira santarosai TaxID=28183 RepID=UPI0024AEA752|nr:ATP-binding cassette domain-containing protein [Leptospira santarosai]MDI7186886.1 ATP-binding cassette domain-containing protein [Leptospira santarosai]MDI7190401.1 ATP-binding cassette domain-containing protein [Leptospira santarosai]MDI7200718.1 ATP-binding cassette domain-containing protein [Leptospira santarosai]MDI7211939.1 ATP-binding cassette domain-containing protein [Leptospira santarosai]MDI7214686.1 ATP-binding cassette domain-containing protein [Leptospira santarosai]
MKIDPLLSVEKLSYKPAGKTILDSVSFEIKTNEHCVLLGRNGAGKSTLVNLIYGMIWATSGKIRLFQEIYGEIPIQDLRKRIGILDSSLQENSLQRKLTVKDTILTGLFHTIGYYRDPSPKEETKTLQILKDAGLYSKKDQLYTTLSSGEKKKILFLRSLVNEPDFLIMDEPCSSLDLTAREDFLGFLKEYYSKKKFTSLYITHRPDEIPEFYSRAVLLKEGRVTRFGPIEECFTENNLESLYDIPLQVRKIEGTWSVIPKRK